MPKRKATPTQTPASKRGKTIMLYNRGRSAYPVYTSVQKTSLKKNQIELKYDVGTITSALVKSAGTVANLTTIAQGTDDFERIGKTINYYDFQFKMNLYPNNAHVGNITTVSIVWDKEPHGTLPTFTQIFDTASPNALPNQGYTNRFKILWQRTFSTTADATTGLLYHPAPTAEGTIDLKGKQASFIGVTNAMADLYKGAIYVTHVGSINDCSVLNMREKIAYYDA